MASQTSAFESLRTRASGILSVAALVTSFSAGLGLVNADPTRGRLLPDWAPWTLLGLLLTLGGCAFLILLPTRQWLHGPSARIIMEMWADGATNTNAKVELTGAMVEPSFGTARSWVGALARTGWLFCFSWPRS
ncbi:hypothetical protein ADK49_04015 [Streptomyces sp. WM6349]|nr:hypothetical protein ADK49_04015 [Streptomyces sp. WM6349]KOV51477.1 hypothetical protein ADK98_06775 [Streptomyces sp. H036]